MNKKQIGFTATTVLMAAVIILLIGVIGWLAWDKLQLTAGKGNATTASSPASSSIDGTSAEKLVSDFYQSYTDGSEDRLTLIQRYGTARLASDFNNAGDSHGAGSDPILCAQAIVPVSVAGHAPTAAGVDVLVTEETLPSSRVPRTLVVSVINQSGLKIDHVVCPQQ